MKHRLLHLINKFSVKTDFNFLKTNMLASVPQLKFMLFILLFHFMVPENGISQDIHSGLANRNFVSVSQVSPEIKEMLQHFDKEIYFTENKGQWPEHVLFKADFPTGQALVTSQGMLVGTFSQSGMQALAAQADSIEQLLEDTSGNAPARVTLEGHGWLMNFLNASPSMRVSGHQPYAEQRNYFTGRDVSGYVTGVQSYKEIWYTDVYDKVDVRYYPAADGTLEYDIICMPGADLGAIALKFDGIDRMKLSEKGELVLNTSVGDIELPKPVVYQMLNGKRVNIEARYALSKNVLGFDVGEYNHSLPLLIDPIALRWATWLTNNSTGDTHIHGIAVDPADGAIYIIARTSGTGLITMNAFQNSSAGDMDIIVSKYLDPASIGGTGTRVWQSYFGGNDYDNPYAMEQGPDGNLYFTGITQSSNFPLLVGSAFSGSSIDKRSQSNYNIFVSKLDKNGTSVKSAVLGGNSIDLAFDLRTTASGNVIVCGYTQSTNLSSNFSGSGATNTNYGRADVLIFSVNSNLNTLNWMKNYGGSEDDKARIMLVDPVNSNIYVGGLTMSSNFPTVNPRQNSLGGSQSGFLQKLSGTGSTIWSSYFRSASSKSTIIQCMDFNATKDKIYFGGLSNGLNSSNISSSGVYSSSIAGSTDMFICRMDTNQTFNFATYLGGSSGEDNMMGLKLDANENVYVFGYTPSTNFPVTSDALQSSNYGYSDKTFSVLNSNLSTLIYSTYVGGSKEEYDPIGERGIQMLGCKTYTVLTAESNNVPLTDGAITTNKLSSYSTYEPGIMVWSNPTDHSSNTISSSQNVCSGGLPSNFTGSAVAYSLPDITRNGTVTMYPSISGSFTYQWQWSYDSLIWNNISGGNTQNLNSSLLGTVSQTTFLRRLVNGSSCNQNDSSSNIIKIQVLTLSCELGNNVSCNGGNNGAVILTPNGGTGPYTYSGPTSGLTAGTYTFIVTDANNCTASCSINISEPAAISSDFNQTACDSYTLPWGTAVTASGNYSHIYTAFNGCDSSVTAHVTILNSSASTSAIDVCDIYTWNGNTYTTSGTYTYSTTNAEGCDSTATLNLTIRYATTSTSTVDVCDSYTWNGNTYNTSGTYTYTTTNAAGCDSTATLNLTIRNSTTSSSTVDVCDNYTWNGNTYNASGTYTYSTTNAAGCDSTATLNLTIRNSTTSSSTVDVCDNYTWNGNTYNTSGTYVYSTTNAEGCDSTATLNLTIRYATTSTSTVDVCDSYTWNGNTYNASGTYTYNTTNAAGCDSTATLNLTIRYVTTSTSTVDVCDSYTWNGNTYNISGTYVYSTLNAEGCDSTATLNLTIRYATTSSSTIDVCDSYTWNGNTYTTSGTYTYTTTNAAGCDSTATLNLTIRYATTSSSTVDVCDSYTWNGNTYNTSGTYTYTTTNAAGCDSTATLNLTIRYATTSTSTVDVCDSYTWNGNTYNTSGTYVYSTLNAAGCDSTATLNLTIRYATTSTSTVDVCDSYTWNGNTYTTSGAYTYSTLNAAGCDSTATLNLTIRNSTTSSSTVDVCDSYTWNGNTYTTSGTYTYSTLNAAGCDSTATLNLTIRNSTTSSSTVDVCDSFTWNGNTYTASGSYTYSTMNAAGCDSMATLNLTIRHSTTSSSTVDVCDSFTWNGNTHTASGTYTYSTTNAAGCDSTATLNLTIRYSTSSTSTVDVCDSYTWNGNTYTASGSYTYSTMNAAGCDSMATLNLTIRHSTTSSSSVDVCDSYTWNGNTYTASGTYTFSTTNAAGCDSTATLNLTIRNSTTSSSTVDVCDSYTWNGNTYTASGTYTYSTTNAAGCDSTATLNLTIRNSTTSSSTVDVCDSYTWNGNTYTSSGTYTYSTLNAAGCDSTATLNLTIRNSTTSSSSVDVCDSYTWNGNTYTASGTYTYSTLNAAGCDSTATLNLTIRNSTTSSSTVDVCDNYTWNGNTYTASGTYTYSTLNASGCDSTATLNLTIRNSTTSSSTVDVCASYTWNGNTYTASGTYTYSTLNAAGCDSTATLNLTIRYASTSSSTVDVCDSYTWNGNTYTASGTYTYSTNNASGCDSTATLNLIIRNSTTSSSNVNVCDSYTWNGNTYTTSGAYTYSTLNAAGCDSTATLNLTIRNSTTSSSTVDVCDSYTWNGNTYTSSGTYTYSTLNAAGCDSTATLNLTIRNSTTSSSTVDICDSYTWNGNTYTTSGTYTYSTTNAAGCDSTATLNLTIRNSTTSSSSVDVCDSYTWNGNTYTASGTYTYSTLNAAGCDSTATLNLTIRNSTASSSTVDVCDSYTWNGNTYTTSGTYTYSTTNAAGCDSTATLNLTIRNSTTSSSSVDVCDSYTWNGNTYTASGTYTFSTTNAAGCDSTATLNLTIRNSTTSSSTVDVCDSYTWNGNTYTSSGTYTYSTLNAAGCDSTATLNLTIRNSTTSSSTVDVCDSYTWNGNTYTASGTYTYSTTNAAGCDSTATLNLTIRSSSSSSETVASCVSYLWPVDGNLYSSSGTYTYVETNGAGCNHTYTLYLTIYTPINASASTVGNIQCYGGTVNVSLSISGGTAPYTVAENTNGLVAGTYTFHITDVNGCTGSATLTINQPAQLLATATAVSPINCFAQSTCVLVSATGGTGAYTGTGTICGAMAGTNTYLVSDINGCSTTATTNLTEPPKIEVSFTLVSTSCGGSNGSATANVIGGVAPYQYAWSNGQTTATATGLAAGMYTLIITDANGCTKSCTITITSGITAPPAPGAISGSPGACRNTSGIVYSIAPVSTATSYNWILPPGASGSSTGTSITLSFSSTYNGGFICVEAVNPCGTSSMSCMNIPVLSVKPAKPGPVSGPAIACGPGIYTYSILPVPNATSYNWTVSGTGVAIMSGQGSTTITVSVPSTFGQGVVGVTAQNCLGVSAVSSMYITGFPQHSSPLFGPGYVCPNTTGVNYNISVITGTFYYVWEVMSGDMTITSQTDNTCIVNFGSNWTSGILRVTTYNSCGGFSRDYNLRSTPTQPLSIAGPSSNLCNMTGVTYSISPVAAATGYTWTVPAGVNIVTNTGTSIVVNFTPSFTGSGNICVTADNACGQSIARCYNVTSRPPQSGAIQGPFSVCKSQSGVVYTILSVPGATSYSWSITGGPTLIAGDTSATVNFTSATTNSATLTVNTMNACGLGSPTRLTILVNLGCRLGDSESSNDVSELLSIYPNPGNGLFDMVLNSENEDEALIRIIDLPGQVLSQRETKVQPGANRIHFDLSDFAKGAYLIQVQSVSGKSGTLRLIIE